jgi:cell pole-organizing protein PopZ
MNKPAPKEPSMDEILSSIRQIIADDDAGTAAPPRPAMPMPPAQQPDRPGSEAMPAIAEPEPLALSAEQIMRDDAYADPQARDEVAARPPAARDDRGPLPLIDPEDVSFDEDDEPARAAPLPPPPVQPRRYDPPAPVSRSAPLPDPRLADDMAEQLLGPAAESAVKDTLGKLTNFSIVGSGLTLEELMRQMLRPMLKEWLDENLPTVVERMVEREIERVSRGRR